MGNITLENWLRNKIDEHESEVNNLVFTNKIRAWIDEYNESFSHSPDPVIDTLQEGDWFQGTEEQYRKVLIEITEEREYRVKYALNIGYLGFSILDKFISHPRFKKNQLTPEEFIRRAENTFNNK